MVNVPELSAEILEQCVSDPMGPVALHLRQVLVPVEGADSPFFPPTYADVGYNIDTLSDGTQVALVDSVGSQANRMEPLFAEKPYQGLVPQVSIAYGDAKLETDGSLSLLEAGHRLGDAIVRCTELAEEAHDAFVAFRRGDSAPLARLAPTSLVFGVWDSRDTQEKIPRLLQASIRAFGVSKLTRSAQYVPAIDYAKLDVFTEAEKAKAEGKQSSELAERGYVHVPSSGNHGGVLAEEIRRDVTINLIALRRLKAENTEALRSYILGLGLVAATVPMDGFLRQGCLLVPSIDHPSEWSLVQRTGERIAYQLQHKLALAFAEREAKAFGVGADRELRFDKKLAKADAKKKSKKA